MLGIPVINLTSASDLDFRHMDLDHVCHTLSYYGGHLGEQLTSYNHKSSHWAQNHNAFLKLSTTLAKY